MYKLIQTGYCMFGSGATIEEARNDARQWLDSPNDADRAELYRRGMFHGDLAIIDDSSDQWNDYE